MFLLQIFLSASSAVLYYAPAWFLQQLVHFLEMTRGEKPLDVDKAWGWIYCGGLLLSTCVVYCKQHLCFRIFMFARVLLMSGDCDLSDHGATMVAVNHHLAASLKNSIEHDSICQDSH